MLLFVKMKIVEKKLWSANGEGDKIILNIHDNEYDEASNIVNTINSFA